MPNLQKAKLARQASSTRPAVQMTKPIPPQAAMDTMMALYSDARRQLDAVELFLSSFEDKVQYRSNLAYGAWLGAEWRIQLATLAELNRDRQVLLRQVGGAGGGGRIPPGGGGLLPPAGGLPPRATPATPAPLVLGCGTRRRTAPLAPKHNACGVRAQRSQSL